MHHRERKILTGFLTAKRQTAKCMLAAIDELEAISPFENSQRFLNLIDMNCFFQAHVERL